MALKQPNIKGEGSQALAFVIGGAFAALVLAPTSLLLDLKAAAVSLFVGVVLLLASFFCWRQQEPDQRALSQGLLQAWRWAALLVAAYAVLQRLGLGQRATGTFGNAGYLAAFLCLTWPSYLAWRGLGRAVALSLVLAALLSTQSRAGLLALAVQLLLWAWQAWREGLRPSRSLGLALLVGALLLAYFFPLEAWTRPTQRWPLWQASWELWLQRPWLGWGAHGFALNIQGHLSPALAQHFSETGQYAEDPHQLLLAIACHWGLLGLSVFGVLLWFYFKAARKQHWRETHWIWLGAVGLLVQSQFDRFFFKAGVLAPFCVTAGLLAWERWPRLGLGKKVFAPLYAAAALAVLGWGLRPLLDYRQAVAVPAALSPSTDWAAQAKAYEEALRLQPSRATAQNLGNCYMMLGEPARAEAAFRQAVALEPGSADAHFSLGYALFHQRRIKEAVAALDQALKLDPAHAHAAKLKEQILQ